MNHQKLILLFAFCLIWGAVVLVVYLIRTKKFFKRDGLSRAEWVERARRELVRRCESKPEELTEAENENYRGWAEALWENRDPDWEESPEEAAYEDIIAGL